jgi:cytochrome c oxidase cbb3-type subunit II
MRSLPLLFLGIFFTLAFSWTGIVLTSHIQMRDLLPASTQLVDGKQEPIAGPTFREPGVLRPVMGANTKGEPVYPLAMSGEALRGKRVYQEMGCLYCHSQQVRRKGFGSDFERGWGNRQSVARDYILQERVMLGTSRTGPDLANVGLRYSALWQHQHLYNPQITSPGSTMPPFPFLYQVQPVSETRGPSADAIELPAAYHPGPGLELVPSQRARDLVAYLMSLSQDYELPEAKFTE